MHKLYYKALQGCYWMMYSASFGYLTYYLEELGFSAGTIGIITAAFGLAGIILQPFVGQLADNPKNGWKKFLVPMVASISVAAIIQMICPVKSVTGIVAGYVTLIEGMMISLVNQACFACSSKEETPDYGSARGMGSITYAVVSISLGQLTKFLGSGVIPVVQLIISVLMLLTLWKLPCIMHEQESGEKHKSEAFFKKYPRTLIVFIGLNMLMLFHCTTTTYIVKITDHVGGDSATMGIALAVSAVAELPIMFSYGKLAKKFSTNSLLAISGVFFIVKGLFYIFGTGVMWIYVGQMFQMLSFAVYANAYVYYAQENVEEKDATRGQAYMAVTCSIGTVVGSLIGGLILEKYPVVVMSTVSLMFAVVGTLILIAYAVKFSGKKACN